MEYSGTKRSSDALFQRSKHFLKRKKLEGETQCNGLLVSSINPRKMSKAVKEILTYLKIHYSKDSGYTTVKKENNEEAVEKMGNVNEKIKIEKETIEVKKEKIENEVKTEETETEEKNENDLVEGEEEEEEEEEEIKSEEKKEEGIENEEKEEDDEDEKIKNEEKEKEKDEEDKDEKIKSEEKVKEEEEEIEREEKEEDTLKEEEMLISCNVEKQIKEEISEMNSEFQRFCPLKNIVKNFTFIKFHEEIKDVFPSDIVSRIFNDINENTLTFKFRHTCKLIPFDYVCKPHLAPFIKCVLPVLKEYFKEGLCVQKNLSYSDLNKLVNVSDEVQNGNIENNTSENDQEEKKEVKKEEQQKEKEKVKVKSESNRVSWALIYRRTNTQTLKRNDVLTILDNCIGSNYSVNLRNPDLAIIVYINEVLCGISIVKNYGKTRKFNIASFREDD